MSDNKRKYAAITKSNTDTQNTSTESPFKKRKTLAFGPEDMNSSSDIRYGSGTAFHTFSTGRFDDVGRYNQYKADTGLNVDTGVKQSFGTEDKHPIFRSRRGSLGGSITTSEGVQSWRLSSFATSKALGRSDEKEAMIRYSVAADKMNKKATNTKGTEQSVNAVLSDFGKVEYGAFNNNNHDFRLRGSTFSQGVSGSGLDKKHSQKDKREVYLDNINTMKARDLNPTASLAYHSEPMAIGMHNKARNDLHLPKLEDSKEMIGMISSFPNQVCAQCGPMLSMRVGVGGVVSGMPGREFGKQKPGVISPESVKNQSGVVLGRATVIRNQPISEFGKAQDNLAEVRAIHAHAHKK